MSRSTYEDATAVIYGMPMDWTVSFRPGSRFGPGRIREASIGLEEYSFRLDAHLEDVAYYDAGDLMLPFGNATKSLAMIREFAKSLFKDGKFPLGLGGEHLVSWPVIQEAHAAYPDLALIHIDAHADLRVSYEGEVLSHATPIRKACELLGADNVYSFGIRSGSREEYDYARSSGMHFYPEQVFEPIKKALPSLQGRPVYITIDIDVLDPASAPGTGTAEAGGITSRELLETLYALSAANINIVGADLVEVAPAYDNADQTSITAAKLIREMLLGWIPKST
ncbi:agmatinase [Bacillaceae bacterium SIJ1]|uniref:agmatinase n=1 Tax=Litoribacterium kuwaitense TaxID=1398745 RepID=UPI0013EB5D0B|nr:agmatinase [Litoribacterium kuwaitense]NGP44704.1 agmatinase [Litoribacterium kuwaitense]